MRRFVLTALVLSTALMLMLGGSNIGEVPLLLNLPTHSLILPDLASTPVVLANDGGFNTLSPFMTTAMDLPGQPMVSGGGRYTLIVNSTPSPELVGQVYLPATRSTPAITVKRGDNAPFMATVWDLLRQSRVFGGGLYNTMTLASSLSPLALATAYTNSQFLGTTSPLATGIMGNDSVPTVSGGPGHVLIASMVTANLANERAIGSWS